MNWTVELCKDQPLTALPDALPPKGLLQIFRVEYLGHRFLLGLGFGVLVDGVPHTSPYANAVVARLVQMTPGVKSFAFADVIRPANAERRVREIIALAAERRLPAIMVIATDDPTSAATVKALLL